ncbi:hypothetical protein EV190_101784 [Actinorugispora endophytica]|uniref:Uncharacterized protein n=1 Tax=Actinorugispora endophytica TaxID=1605990 RepID=A0A4R6VEI4_9ACTN|nr:hypothetical protein EV190_101784 [Actinorugispora endophytica]
MGGAELSAGGGFLEELGGVAADFGVGEDGGEDRPGRVAQVGEIAREQWDYEAGAGIQLIRHEIPDRRLVHHAHAVFLAGGERLNVGSPAQWSTWAWEFESGLYTDLSVR